MRWHHSRVWKMNKIEHNNFHIEKIGTKPYMVVETATVKDNLSIQVDHPCSDRSQITTCLNSQEDHALREKMHLYPYQSLPSQILESSNAFLTCRRSQSHPNLTETLGWRVPRAQHPWKGLSLMRNSWQESLEQVPNQTTKNHVERYVPRGWVHLCWFFK